MRLGVSENFLVGLGERAEPILDLLEFKGFRLMLLIEFLQYRRRLRHVLGHAHFIVIVQVNVWQLNLIEVVPQNVARQGLVDIEHGQSRRDEIRDLELLILVVEVHVLRPQEGACLFGRGLLDRLGHLGQAIIVKDSRAHGKDAGIVHELEDARNGSEHLRVL